MKRKFKNIFLVTEQKKYLEALKENINNVVYFKSFRSGKLRVFSANVRKYHTYKLGKESLMEVLILSKAKHLICSRSNILEFAEMV